MKTSKFVVLVSAMMTMAYNGLYAVAPMGRIPTDLLESVTVLERTECFGCRYGTSRKRWR